MLLAPLIFSQSISVNGLSLNQTTGVCDPSTFQTVGTASINADCIQLNAAGNFEQGGLWVCNSISLDQSFKLNFKANFGSDQTTGDGIAFVLQEEGLNVIGGTGGGMGYANGNPINCLGGACPIEPSVVIEFDTYNGSSFGDNDIACNHTSIQTGGSTAIASTISGPECLLPAGTSIVDGNDHDICITWNPFSLQYRAYFDGAIVTAYNGDIRSFFNSPSSVYWGFTSSSGGATQIHSVCEIEMLTSIPNPTCICNTPNLVVTDPPTFCEVGNITDVSITAGSDAGNLTYWNNSACTNALTNPNLLLNSGVYYIQLETTPGCTTSQAVNLTVDNIVTPEFDVLSHICVGEPIVLPSTSLNGVNGTWSPAPNNTSTTTYTFTPDSDECALPISLDIIVRPAPTIEPISDIIVCSGDDINFNAIIGGIGTNISWSSSGGSFSNPTEASTAFVPDFTSGNTTVTALVTSPICSLTNQENINITINTANTVPSFTPIADICSGDALSLPATSTNGISGTWSPAVDNTTTTTYTFTPDAGQCAANETMTIEVNTETSPTFNPIADICSGDALSLPATSTNGISGTWSPAVDNTTTTTYTFTPDGGQCATSEDMTVNVNAQTAPNFTPIADICSGDALILPATSTNGISGTWSPAVDNTTTTTYTFTPDVGQCAISEDMTVNVNAVPVFNSSLLNDPTFCSGSDGAILIDGLNALSTYDVSYNDGLSNIGPFSITTDASGAAILTSLSAGAYSNFTISDGNCSYSVTNSVNLTDPLAPDFAASGFTNPSSCQGNDGEIILTGLLSNTPYLLSYVDDGVSVGPLNISSDVSGKIQISNLDAGVYSGFVLDLAGCSGSTPSSITLVDPSVPVLQITDPLAVCTPGTVDLSLPGVTVGSTGGDTLSYWIDASATIPLVDPSAVANSGTYYIQSTSNGCTDIAAVNVVVNQTPDLQITDPLAVCTPGTVDLSSADVTAGSTGGGLLSYWTDASATTPLVDPSAVAGSGTYYIQSESNGCTDIEAVNVVINQTPSFSVSGTDPSVCNASDGLITLTGLNPSTAYTLSYDSLAMSAQTINITSDASGNYLLQGLMAGLYDAFSITLNGCAFTATENIDLNNPSAPSVDLQLDTTVCDTYTLEVITGSNLSGNEAYYSQSNGAGVALSPGDVITTSQTVYVYDNIGACSDEISFVLTVNATPQITNLPTQEACVGYTLPVIEGINLSGNENYFTDAQANGGVPITNPITTSQQVFIYDASGACSDEVSFEVIIYDLPEVISFSGEGTYCQGDVIEPLNVTLSGMGQLTLEYSLDGVSSSATSDATSIVLGNAPGVYVLTQITDAHCSNTTDLTQTITVNATPAIPSTSGDASYCTSEVPQVIEAQGSTGSYTWYADQDLTDVIGNEAQYTPENILGTSSYYVAATENGCEGLSQMITISFQECGIIIPTAFTPDGDQTNDTWKLENIDDIYPNNVVSVYNRLGNKVFEAQQGSYNQMPWDGTFNGQELPVGSYYYIIEYNDNTTEKTNGIVTIIK